MQTGSLTGNIILDTSFNASTSERIGGTFTLVIYSAGRTVIWAYRISLRNQWRLESLLFHQQTLPVCIHVTL